MTLTECLDALSAHAHKTQQGIQVDIRLIVHPDGRGVIEFSSEPGEHGPRQSVDRPSEAADVVRRVWEEAARLGDEDTPPSITPIDRGREMADALRRLGELGAFRDIDDPVAWQREQREDRDIGRDEP